MTIQTPISDNATLALTQIRRLIEHALPQDGRLPTERELSARLGTGRRAVRRALETLEAEGLIWRRQGKGTFAGQPPDPADALLAHIAPETDVLSVMEARLALEPALADLCARRASAEDIVRLRHLSDRATASADADSAELWDGALHRLIARTAGNRLLLTAFTLLDEVRMGADWQARRHRARSPGTMDLYDRQHRAIIDAIAAGDGGGARAAMTAHLDALCDNLRRSMGDAAP